MGNPATTKEFISLLQADMYDVFYDNYKELPLIKDQFFKVVKDSKAWLEYMALGDVPDPTRFEGVVTYQGFSSGYKSKITPLEYAGGVTIERRLLDTDQYDAIRGRTKRLAGAANRKMNKIAHEPFVFHDSSAFSFLESEEGVALCSNSHTTKSGTSTASGFDNLSVLPFDAVNLETVRQQGRGFKSDISERIDTNFDTIVYGTANAEAVWEVMNSQGKLDEMTNNANFHRNKWKEIELPLLDDYDPNDWFLIDSGAMKDSLIWHEGVPLELNQTTDFDTFMQKFITYFAVGWGFIDWRWIIGNSVS